MPRPQQLTEQLIAARWQPLATTVAAQIAAWRAPPASTTATPLLIGLSGAQGSGKSTLAALLATLLTENHQCKSLAISLDDFYLTAAQRAHRAATIHPLFATRGVPGTHDLPLLNKTITALLHSSGETRVPRFDKSRDDRAPAEDWLRVQAPLDIIILEGWCLGATSAPKATLAAPLNSVEATQDPHAHWRRHVNKQLETYAQLWARLDKLLLLQAPDWETICHWRAGAETARPGGPAMTAKELNHFMQHYERIARALLREQPHADMTWTLDAQRRIVQPPAAG